MHTHNTYFVTHNDIIIYIGSGLPTRYKHTVSGTSYVYELNKLHFLEPDTVKVNILKGYSSSEEALEDEKKLILEFKPKCNTQWLDDEERYNKTKDDILKYSEEFIPFSAIKAIGNNQLDTKTKIIQQKGKANFKKVAKLYEEALKENDQEVIDMIETDIDYKDLTDFVELIGVDKLVSHGYQKSRLVVELEKHRLYNESPDILRSYLKFKDNVFYSLIDIKERLQVAYDTLGISKKAKATDIQSLYNTHRTIKKSLNGFIVIRKR